MSNNTDRVAVKLVKKGQNLAEAYLAASARLINDELSDLEYDQAIVRYYRSRYFLRSHVELLETLRATYSIFGQVY